MGISRRNSLALAASAIAGALLIASCATQGMLANGEFRNRYTRYRIGSPGAEWKSVKIRGADLAWIADDGATLLANSLCKGSQDVPLLALTGQLLIGMTEQNIISQTTLSWSGREALETVASVKIDGVRRQLKMFVLKKDGCVYDIVLAAPPKTFDERERAYQTVRDQFDVGTRT